MSDVPAAPIIAANPLAREGLPGGELPFLFDEPETPAGCSSRPISSKP